MKVIETRPEMVSDSCKFENIPLYLIDRLDHLVDLDGYDLLIFQSPVAVMTFYNLPERFSFPIIGMGSGTVRELNKKNLEALAPKEANSQGAIDLLDKLSFKKALVIKGKGGLDLIEKYLSSSGVNYDVCESYARQRLENYLDVKNKFTDLKGIIFSSVFAVEIFFSEIFNESLDCHYFAISERIKKSILKHGHKAIVVDYFAKDLKQKIESTLT